MESRIITIVGGSGFLGRYIARDLASRGYRLRIVCRRPEAAKWLKIIGNVGQVALVRGDLAKPETIAPHLVGAYAVVNCVGILFEGGSQRFAALQAQGAGELAKQAARAGVSRFVHLSALGVDQPTTSAYAASKRGGEQAVLSVFAKATVLRPSVVFGAEDQFLNQFAALATVLPFLPAFGGGKTKFQPVYVGDIAKAAVAAIESDAHQGKIYELGGPEVKSFKQILQFILETIGRKTPILPVPFPIASAEAFVFELGYWLVPFIRKPLLTRDQVKLLKVDNVVREGARGFAEFGMVPMPMEAIAPEYLARFRVKRG